ncbi:hypothetical protein GGR54DRAFT_78796 [Hypoxylon sp. NC1633]|nr:hypothetical protein GGR54DRAFT_78796 [Hypoxylon sp. NC1633]
MFEQSCPVSGSVGGNCPVGHASSTRSNSRMGPRGCTFSGYCQPGDLHAAFDIPRGVDAEEWLRMRERKSINQLLYTNIPSVREIDAAKTQAEIDAFNAREQDLLAVALGAPARQVMLRAEEIGPKTGWIDGYLSAEHGFCPPDYEEAAGALARTPGRIWADLCDRMPGCVARGRVQQSVAALPLVEGTKEVIPDQALWAALVSLGMLCSIYRFESKYDGNDGITSTRTKKKSPNVPMGDDLGEELVGIPRCIALPYYQVSRRMGRTLPHLTFPDQSSYNIKIRDPTSHYPYVARFDNIDLRWSMFGEKAEVAFLKGCADTSASFQHGPDAIAACQEHVMSKNVEGLLREMIRLKEILERMPNAFHSINVNPNSGDNYVPVHAWHRWAKFSAPLSKRCPASSGLQFPPYLVMDAFLGRKKYTSFLGAEGVHLRAWLPSNLRAFIAAIEYHYRIPEFVQQSGDPRLMGVLDGIVEAYTGERGFMGTHRYKVFGILEIAAKTGRTETNGASGASDASRPWEETHRQFSDAMKERLEPYRGNLSVEPHQMRGSFEECRYVTRVLNRSYVDSDPTRSIALVTLDIQDTGITFMPGDRLAVMPLNSWEECAKVAAALGLETRLDDPFEATGTWSRFEQHLTSVRRLATTRRLTVADILHRGHLAPITKELALRIHTLLAASSNTVLQVLATDEWPVRGSLGDLLQDALLDTPAQIWDKAFDLNNLSWLAELIPVEVPRTYSIASYTDELLPSTVDLAISRAEYKLCSTFSKQEDVDRAGVASGFFNPYPPSDDMVSDDEILVGVSRPLAFQLPLDPMAPCAFFAGGSGIAPFRSFWQYRLTTSGLSGGKNYLYLGVQSREKFCFEEELREYVNADFMEVHMAFSRDSRGLVYDPHGRDLIEKHIPPRYIDTLIVEQGATISDLVMSKKQGGLGGYLYVCGSVAVFDSVMNGIRKAVYTHCTATMESVDLIVNKAFAERRFMLDVFMTPKPLPCNLPTIPLSQLAQHTGHRPGSRMWIGVHGSVYDVTDFTPMHPGGAQIIESNAGVDCSKSFDNLAHTNNPEVASLLTKYFVGHLTPKPDYQGGEEDVSALYDLWAAYLRTTVETLVAHRIEMHEIQGASLSTSSSQDRVGSTNIWLRENLPNILAIRTFYGYQSRLLQGGFAALFGAKLQELVLKLSFGVANAGGAGGSIQLPDVLGAVARANTSADAVKCMNEVALVGQFICGSADTLRFQERGVFAYAAKSVELDIELLEDLRQEIGVGMDAFDSIASTYDSSDKMQDPDFDAHRLMALSTFLLQILERIARRLGIFYAQLAQCSVYRPELERNPARTRWALVRRCIRDGSLFVMAHETAADVFTTGQQSSYYMSRANPNQNVDFDSVLSQVRATLGSAQETQMSVPQQPLTLNAVHQARGRSTGDGSALAVRENAGALKAMNSFVEKNSKAIRRLSKMPPMPMNFEELQKSALGMAHLGLHTPPAETHEVMAAGLGIKGHNMPSFHARLPSPPSSRGSSRSPSRVRLLSTGMSASAEMLLSKLNQSRSRGNSLHSRQNSVVSQQAPAPYYPVIGGLPTPPTSAQPKNNVHAAMSLMMTHLNTRRPPASAGGSAGSHNHNHGHGHMSTQSTNSLRAFKLRGSVEAGAGAGFAERFGPVA